MTLAQRIIPFLIAAALVSCSGADSYTPVPKPRSFPRIVLYPDSFVAIDHLPINIEVNAAAIVTDSIRPDASRWITAIYPSYQATLFITVSPIDRTSRDAVIANRLHRIDLNNVGAKPRRLAIEATASHIVSEIFIASQGSPTPLQFIAEAPDYVVSGAVLLEDAAKAPSDSIRPIIKALETDIIHLASALR